MKPCPDTLRPRRLLPMAAGLLLLLTPGLAAEGPETGKPSREAGSRAYIDWGNRHLHIMVSAPVDQGEVRNRSTLLSRKESELQLLFPTLFPFFLHPVRVDSSRSLEDLVKQNPGLERSLGDLRAKAILVRSQPSPDLKSLTLEYLFPLTPNLNALLVDFDQPSELPRNLPWQPAAEYTGLVIHAEGRLPWYGSDRESRLVPALFPRILDEDGRVVLDTANLLPAAARRWGSAGYASGIRPELQSERAGDQPFIAMARAVYGVSPCDVVISRNDASVLLYNESTRRALAEGRIIIAIDQEGLSEQLAP